jgi:CHASE3 domain sensor protein
VGRYEIRVRTSSVSDSQPVQGEDKTVTVEVVAPTNIIGTALIVIIIVGLIAGIVIFGIKLSRR